MAEFGKRPRFCSSCGRASFRDAGVCYGCEKDEDAKPISYCIHCGSDKLGADIHGKPCCYICCDKSVLPPELRNAPA